jgi:hypothetical protein
VKNFDWEEWRKRFLKHHNNKKSRVTDLFRKLDEDGDGFLSRLTPVHTLRAVYTSDCGCKTLKSQLTMHQCPA